MNPHDPEFQRIWNILADIKFRLQIFKRLSETQKIQYTARLLRAQDAGYHVYGFPKHKLP